MTPEQIEAAAQLLKKTRFEKVMLKDLHQKVWPVIADNGTDGAWVYGAGVKRWRDLDLVNTEVSLVVNGKRERLGLRKNVLGDPLGTSAWLVNARPRDGGGLNASDIRNTGAATDIYRVNPGDTIVASFKGLGEASLDIR